jgi:hypothetical protein
MHSLGHGFVVKLCPCASQVTRELPLQYVDPATHSAQLLAIGSHDMEHSMELA